METPGYVPKEYRDEEEPKKSEIELESETTDSVENREHQPLDALIVLGSNIRADENLTKIGFLKPELMKTKEGNSRLRLPMAAKFRVIAAAELFLKGETEKIILTGGKTKESQGVEESEAMLMKDYLEKILRKRWRSEIIKQDKQIAEEELEVELDQRWAEAEQNILLEDKAVSTLQNFAYTANLIDQEPSDPDNPRQLQNCGVLSNRFHVPRALLIAQIFKINGVGVAAEDALSSYRHHNQFASKYFDLEGNRAYRESVLSALSEDERPAVEAKLGMSMEKYDEGERYGMNVLDKVPKYWLPDVQYVENPERLRQILQAKKEIEKIINEELRTSGVDADIETASDEQLRAVLGKMTREVPPPSFAESK